MLRAQACVLENNGRTGGIGARFSNSARATLQVCVVCAPLRVGSNRLWWALDLHWRSPEFRRLLVQIKAIEKTVCRHLMGWWVRATLQVC